MPANEIQATLEQRVKQLDSSVQTVTVTSVWGDAGRMHPGVPTDLDSFAKEGGYFVVTSPELDAAGPNNYGTPS